MAGSPKYEEVLARLMRLAGSPAAADVREEMRRELPRSQRPPADSTIADWITGRTIPRQDEDLEAFLSALYRMTKTRRLPMPQPALPSREQWRRMAEGARNARRKGAAVRSAPASLSPRVPDTRQIWLDEVAGSRAWRLLKAGDEGRAEPLRKQALEVAGRLSELYEDAREALTDDPWQDTNLAPRTARRTNQLLHMVWRDEQDALVPAEAALLALLPFLHQVHRTRTAAELSRVNPTDLRQMASADPERQAYEVLLRGHERLVRRTELGHLSDRPDGRREIGWWLFHQWAKRQPGQPQALRRTMDVDGTDIGAALDPELLPRLLSSAHVTPQELHSAAHEGHRRNEVFPLDFGGRDFQDVRERLLGLVIAVAHCLAIEVTDLSSAIVKHVGIPDPLDPARLLATVRAASWRHHLDVLGLTAECDHPAAVAALTDHTLRVESLLRGIRQTAVPELGTLPVYTNADQVREGDALSTPRSADRVIRFRLDEERVQELLMGENLYRDRSLAIRELYQNALDACRYRRAREQARNGPDDDMYQGRIAFHQGIDEDGRPYLECRDNGVGMNEIMLSEVFSQAGVRFTDLPRYQEERREWHNQGITIYPNSRFGIGVLSYFMLADEIRVTTCHMDGSNGRLAEITVLITGPGHYFRIRSTGRPGTIGTTVRLYLRNGDKTLSCVTELRRLLGIAEFRTTAEHGTQRAEWLPGVMNPREAPGYRYDGFDAYGRLASWSASPGGSGGQVVWCEYGGGILVDGIYAEPRVQHGVLTDPGGFGKLYGAVVNLTGESRPKRLSVDRTEILDDDVCLEVEQLIRAALPTLLTSEPSVLDTDWLENVAGCSPRLADIVTEAAGAADYELELHDHSSSVATAGFFPQDMHIVHRDDSGLSETKTVLGQSLSGDVYGHPDDATLLWRLLAQRPNAELATLVEIVPELARVKSVLAALPSDVLARTSYFTSWRDRAWPRPEHRIEEITTPGHTLFVASVCGTTYGEAFSRMERLRMPPPVRHSGDPIVDPIGLALLTEDLRGLNPPEDMKIVRWIDADAPVPPGHLVKAHLVLDISVEEAVRRMRAFGFTVPDEDALPPNPNELTLRVLSTWLNGKWPWLDPSEPVALDHVLRAAVKLQRPVLEVTQELRTYGYRVEIDSTHERSADGLLRQGAEWGWDIEDWQGLKDGETIPPGLLVRTSLDLSVPLIEIARRIQELGFAPPPALPDHADEMDRAVLSVDAVGEAPWLTVHTDLWVTHVAMAALETGLSPSAVASRLHAYGLVPPDPPFAERAEPNDVLLLQMATAASSKAPLSQGWPVPVHRVVQIATELRVSPQDVVERLAQYGLSTPLGTAPTKASRFDLELLSLGLESGDRHDEGPLLDWDKPVPLHHLIAASARLFLEPREVTERLSAFGFRVPDYQSAQVDEVDRRLCAEQHQWGNEASYLPLGLRQPMVDFLRIARFADMPNDELVRRLEGLGVDLQRVADSVRATLPQVPGLVMEDGSGPPPGTP
ncbi:wHTH domain-containing protein [Streptomyces malaysiensis]|uniref:wHTH domain-containing protein n=1 Tax=Streptomyces malaysiensis TaxID=92644 RepID=UPI00114CFDEC|nr:hypothetical protein [Streptomyces sp. SPMA113]